MWKMLWLLLVAFQIAGDAASPSVRPQSQRGIIFPAIEQYEDCFVDETRTVKGTCKRLADCASALQRWQHENVRPRTCFFNKFDHVVCCAEEQTPIMDLLVYTPKPDVKRRSEKECDSYYGLKIMVVHGEPTKPKEFPYMAALGWESFFDKAMHYRCGGVLVSDRFVLTAAHCATLGGAPPAEVRLGGVNLTDSDAENVKVKRVIIHPDYNGSSSYNDIALVELQQAVSETPVCIWSEHDVPHQNVTAIGYGHTRFAGPGSDQLLKAALFVVPNDNCEKFYAPDVETLHRGVASTHICAGDPEHLRDTCQGDSGGPIIMNIKQDQIRAHVVGITSFGLGCAGEPPSIYTRISSYVDWIEDVVWPTRKANSNI